MTAPSSPSGEPSPSTGDSVAGVQRIGFGRRLLVMAYESLLLFGVLFGAGLPVVMIAGHTPDTGNPLYLVYLLGVSFAYFGWCWTRAGQTLAMRAWKVLLEREDGGRPGWREAALRYLGGLCALACALAAAQAAARAGMPGELQAVAALLGAAPAFGWALFDRHRRAWPDIFSATRLVRRPPVSR